MIEKPNTHPQPLPKGGELECNGGSLDTFTSTDKAIQGPSLRDGYGVGAGSRDGEGLKLLGSRTTEYRMDYAPRCSKHS